MLKYISVATCFVLLFFSTSAQTLFTYGGEPVTVAQFVSAYNKNNAGAKSTKALQEYLNLYIASRLKIKEAKELRYDTLSQLKADLENLRSQIINPYLIDQDAVNKLVNEAYSRSQKDIHLAHIFISVKDLTAAEEKEAEKKVEEVKAALKKGTSDKNYSFTKIAQQYSDDPSVKMNGGDLGWVTVFSLPYELENLAYATPVGTTSSVYQSKAGYHIFKNLGERKALGRMKAAQILLAFPPNADEATKKNIKKLADSLYSRLTKGDDFATLATQYSNDAFSASAGGSIPEFGVGQYDPVFETILFGQLKNGEISKPFLTSYGYHIVKRITRVPVPALKNDAKAMAALREKVEGDDRMKTTKDAVANKVLNSVNFRKEAFRPEDLWAFSDSVMDFKITGAPLPIKNETPLFTIGEETTTAGNWIVYAQTFRYKSDGSGLKAYPLLWDEFVKTTALDYYRAHLENFNEGFRNQLAEFKDGNLFFEIMQRKIWTPSQTDSTALQNYYNQHRKEYQWGKSVDAVIFYASDAAAAQQLRDSLKKNATSWKNLVAATNEKVAADSGRFEIALIPSAIKTDLKKGELTLPVTNESDHTSSFAYIINLHSAAAPRSFAEAKSLVTNDYQAALDKEWIVELKKKYPVVMNEKELSRLTGKK